MTYLETSEGCAVDVGTLLFLGGMSLGAFLAWLCVWAGEFKGPQ